MNRGVPGEDFSNTLPSTWGIARRCVQHGRCAVKGSSCSEQLPTSVEQNYRSIPIELSRAISPQQVDGWSPW